MEKLHAKTGCAHACSTVHAKRRRRCRECGITWTVRKRRRGRKRTRGNIQAVVRYVQGKSVALTFKQLRKSRDAFIRKTQWPVIPAGPCILIADALHIRTATYRAIVHLILVKPLHEERAYILPPFVDSRGENKWTWAEALTNIPVKVLSNTQALVCDGRTGLPELGAYYGWLVQRCTFHLIARLQMKRSKYILSRHRREGVFLYELFTTVCTTRSSRKLKLSLEQLRYLAQVESHRQLRSIFSGLIKHHGDYRTYIEHPLLELPATTNAVECLNSIIRRFLHRARGFQTAPSALAWIEALLKCRQFIRVKNHRN